MPSGSGHRADSSRNLTIVISFLIVLTLMTLSGALAWINRRKTPEDYLVASRKVPPWLSALSAVSTNNSGFMFIAMIAFTYRFGFESVWLIVGWFLGDMTAWIFVHGKVRRLSEEKNANTLPALFDFGDRRGNRALVYLAGLIVFIFLSVYAAAQLKASNTALNALFDWDMYIGVLIGTFIVGLYSSAGGIRADIWTDAAQSFVMIVTMGLILGAGMQQIGGFGELTANLERQDPALVTSFPGNCSSD